MIILDTNVLSALMVKPAESVVLAWLDRQPEESTWTTSITILEIRFGLEIMERGRRRDSRILAFRRLIDEEIEHRVAPFDDSAATAAAELMAANKRAGTPRELRDTMIAGIALSRRAELATRNVKHFAECGIEIVNPWED